MGAHAGGYNLVSTGVAMLGSFMGVPISAPARSALERLLAWKLSLHGLPSQGRVTVKVNPAGAVYSRFPANAHVSLRRISGHRDADSTDCPGDVLYGELGGIRSAVSGLARWPVQATLLPGPATATGPAVAGGLRFLDGSPIAGAKVLLQLRRVARKGEVVTEETIGEASTDEKGEWSLPGTLPPGLTPPGGTSWLRALCTGVGTGPRSHRRCISLSPPLNQLLNPLLKLPRPRHQLPRLQPGETDLWIGLHEQGRVRTSLGPLVAGRIEGIVDPCKGPPTRICADRIELPVGVAASDGALEG